MAHALYVGTAKDLRRRSLLLAAGQHRLTELVDPTTEQPGDLPVSLVSEIRLTDDRVHVVFADQTELALNADDPIEAVSP